MKTKKLLPGFTAVFFLAMTFFACKKQESQEMPPASVNGAVAREDVSILQSITQQWHIAFAKTASIKEAASSAVILEDLDYSASYRMQSDNGKYLLLIKLKTQTTEGNVKFLALESNGTTYDLDGIYEAKNINTIRTFFTSKTFRANDSIVVRSVIGNPVKAWVTDAADNVQYKKGLAVAKGQDAKAEFLKQQKLASSSHTIVLHNEPPPPSDCIAWFWIWYDPASGIFLGAEYLGTTGDCDENSGGGGGNGRPEYLYCGQYTASEIGAMVAGAYLEDVDEVSYNNGQPYTDVDGRIRKPVTPTWKVMECRIGLTGKYVFTAYYSGVKFRTHAQDPSWKWESFSYSSFDGTWEWAGCAIGITILSVSHSESRKDDYVWDVSIAFSALVKTNVPGIPLSNESNTVVSPSKAFSFDAAYSN
jgi:hypothetical protein